jgi:hypothetical protein
MLENEISILINFCSACCLLYSIVINVIIRLYFDKGLNIVNVKRNMLQLINKITQ